MPLNNLIPADSTATAVTATVQDKFLDYVEKISDMSLDEIAASLLSSAAEFIFKILIAIAIYFVGRWIIRRITKFLKRIFELRQLELSLSKFIISLVNIALSIILIVITIGLLGINTTSFLAIFASAGLAVGMALSGTLQNFAGGVLILFLKPYKIGDFVEAQGYSGTVKEISLFSTLINTIDNKMVIIPNGSLSTGIINNYSKESTRRVEWIVGVAYGTDYDVIKELLGKIINENDQILKDKEIFIALHTLADSSVNIVVRAWVNSDDYWSVYFNVNEQVYKRLNEAGINIPFPQMDVHLHNN